jgi:hypothetical protein
MNAAAGIPCRKSASDSLADTDRIFALPEP